MGEFTSCNYCKLQGIKRRAKEDGLTVTVLGDANWGMGGENVYVHPKDINISQLAGGEDGPRAKYRVSWMMGIGSRCEC